MRTEGADGCLHGQGEGGASGEPTRPRTLTWDLQPEDWGSRCLSSEPPSAPRLKEKHHMVISIDKQKLNIHGIFYNQQTRVKLDLLCLNPLGPTPSSTPCFRVGGQAWHTARLGPGR